MAFNINQFRAELQADGARPTLFEIEINFPVNLGAGAFPTQKAKMMGKSSILPASTIGMIEVPYFGRKIKVAGDRTYDDWTCTFINDEDFKVRNALEYWSTSMDQHSTIAGAKRVNGANENPYSYVTNLLVKQYGKQGEVVKTYTLVNAWPVNVGQIDVSWEANDQIEEFDVQWTFDYFIANSADGGVGNTIV